ncbi:hypothetical protein Q7P35_010946 [Cladosporium inversicolor]
MTNTVTMSATRCQRIRSQFTSWVMLSPATSPPFTPLPNEQALFTSPPRIALAISSPSHYPGKQQQPFSAASSTGVVYLTNRRLIYIPDKSTDKLQSFAAPILNIHDSHVTAPFFGPNVWQALLQPVHGGGIPTPTGGVVELKLTFKDGGAFDFHTHFERIKERLQQAVEVSRIHGDGAGGSAGAMHGVDVSNVNAEDLPVYSEESDGPLLSPVAASLPRQQPVQLPVDTSPDARPQPRATDNAFSPPDEPPPGYEEAQMATLQDQAAWREEAERRQ